MIENRLTKADIARICDVHYNAVVKWEHGGGIKADKLRTIATYFGVSMEQLLRETDDPSPAMVKEPTLAAYGKAVPAADPPDAGGQPAGSPPALCQFPADCANRIVHIESSIEALRNETRALTAQLRGLHTLLGAALRHGGDEAEPEKQPAAKAG